MGWLSGWTYRKKITIDNTKVDASLVDFPVLVALTNTNFDFTKAQPGGEDIRFTSSDGETLLKYERERHDSVNELAEYHVKVSSVSSSADTEIYLYYGNSGASDGEDAVNVWDSNFVAVYHMNNDPSGGSGCILDSTSNASHGTPHGSMTSGDMVSAKVGYGIDFDGSDDYIEVPYNSTLDVDYVTFEGILWPDSVQESTYISLLYQQTSMACFYKNTGDFHGWVYTDPSTSTPKAETTSSPFTDEQYAYFAMVYDQNTISLYVDATREAQESRSGAIYDAANPLRIAVPKTTNPEHFKGILDEIRVSSVARSSAWIKATYHSLFGTLLSLGGEEAVTPMAIPIRLFQRPFHHLLVR